VLEGLFGLVESYAAQALDAFLNDPAGLSEGDRADLAYLIVLQEQRVPGFLGEFTARIEQMGTMKAAIDLANIKGPKNKRRRGLEASRALVEGRVRMVPSRELVLTTMLQSLAAAPLVAQIPWTLFRATEGSFVCSDRPVTKADLAAPHKWSGAAWLSSPSVNTTMPLTPTACLRISPGDPDRLAVRGTRRQSERINLRTYGWATRFVYGASRGILEELHAYAVAHPDEVPAPSPQRAVIFEDLATADPAVASANAARGWDPTLMMHESDGTFRTVSYRVIDTIQDARDAVSPRPQVGDVTERS
jgi:hypothetical protein